MQLLAFVAERIISKYLYDGDYSADSLKVNSHHHAQGDTVISFHEPSDLNESNS